MVFFLKYFVIILYAFSIRLFKLKNTHMRDSTLLIHMSFRANFFFEVVNSVTCDDRVVLCIKDFLKRVCNEGHNFV